MKRKTILFLSIFFIICMIITVFPSQQAIVFQPNYTKGKLAYIPVENEEEFKIIYTHSIHLSEVVESYKITTSDRILQYELMYEDFAIGMPANAEAGETFVQKDGKYYIKNMKLVFPFFYLRIGQIRANHRVMFKNKKYQLSRFIRPGTSVKVEIRKLNYLEQWKGVNILEPL